MAAPCLTEGMLSARFSKNSGYNSSMLGLGVIIASEQVQYVSLSHGFFLLFMRKVTANYSNQAWERATIIIISRNRDPIVQKSIKLPVR